jgi:hypothetical protein
MSAAQTEILCLMDAAVEWMHTPKGEAGNRERNRSDLDEPAVTRLADASSFVATAIRATANAVGLLGGSA